MRKAGGGLSIALAGHVAGFELLAVAAQGKGEGIVLRLRVKRPGEERKASSSRWMKRAR